MKKIFHDTFSVVYPVAIVVVLYMGGLSFGQKVNVADLAGATAVLVGVSVGLLTLPILAYHFIAKKSRCFAVIFYYALLLILSWWISPGLKAELGYDGFFVIFMIVLLGYGGAAGWTLSRPTFLRILPATILTIILLVLYYSSSLAMRF